MLQMMGVFNDCAMIRERVFLGSRASPSVASRLNKRMPATRSPRQGFGILSTARKLGVGAVHRWRGAQCARYNNIGVVNSG